jgi:hypothetical protein
LELQVAFALFGLGVATLGPMAIMQSRQLRRLEDRFQHETTYYLAPSDDPWARKLGAAAALETTEPTPAVSPAMLIDRGDSGYAEEDGSDDWHSSFSSNACGGTLRWHDDGDGSGRARWVFAGLAPGWYQVLVTYDSHNWHADATNAPYSVYDDSTLLETVRVDQTQPPSGPTHAGLTWQSLGTYSIASDTLQVELTDDADDDVVADAVWIVRVENKIKVVSLEKTLGQDEAAALVSVTVEVPEP